VATATDQIEGGLRPLPPSERYAQLDILRGVALYGVLIVNLLWAFRESLAANILGAGSSGLVQEVVAALIEFKAFSLYSFLFGTGVALQADRARSRGAATFLSRRFAVLAAIGLVHMQLIWNGDILVLYAVCGFLLIPLLLLPDAALGVLGAVAIAIAYLVPMPVAFPSMQTLRTLAAGSHIYAQGTLAEILAFRWQETRGLILPLYALSLPRTLGLMMWGVAAWRSGLLRDHRRLWWIVLLAGGTLGIAGTLLHSDLASTVPLALAYAAAILLWLPRAPLLAAAGRMSLTNYLAQSVIFGFVFYSYGLGLFGRVSAASAAVGGTLLYVAQLWFSRWWLERYRYGPCEWLWRSLTYGTARYSVRR
jgi:uncharacterized protein